MKKTMRLSVTIEAETRIALLDEAAEKDLPIERHVSELLELRFAHPTWPDRAEAQALAAEVDRLNTALDGVTAELDRARESVIRHDADAMVLRRALDNVTGDTLASLREIGGARAELRAGIGVER